MEEKKEENIVNKVVIVTGGSRGIGSEIVKELANNNYNVVLNYNKSEKQAKEIQKELLEMGKNIQIFKADVSNREEVKRLIQFTIDTFGKIDVLINNAGISQESLFTDVTDYMWKELISINLNSVFYCTQEALPYMINKKQGCVINISSIWGETGGSYEVAYSTTKAAINGLTKALSKEVGPSNIRVNAIAPGIINTDMNKNLSNTEIEQIKNQIPLGKIGKTTDISKCIKWLIEDEYTTGQIISVNGGWYI